LINDRDLHAGADAGIEAMVAAPGGAASSKSLGCGET